MAAGTGVRGVARLRESLDSAARELSRLDRAHVEAGQLLAQAGSSTAPRRTGRLAESVGYTITDAGFDLVAAAPYAAFVHARNPWLVRTVDANTEAVTDIYAEAVAETVSHIKGA